MPDWNENVLSESGALATIRVHLPSVPCTQVAEVWTTAVTDNVPLVWAQAEKTPLRNTKKIQNVRAALRCMHS
jgi:hypothetical protein